MREALRKWWGHSGFFPIFPPMPILFFIVMMIVQMVTFPRYGYMGEW